MNERDLVATQTIVSKSEGGDQVRADLRATAGILDQVAASSANLATVTETSARRQTSASAAFNAMARSLDPAAKAFADLERNQRTFGNMVNQNLSALDKAGQGLDVYARKLGAASAAAEALRRQQANASVNQGQGFNPGTINTNTYATEFAKLLEIADAKAAQIGKQFGESLTASMTAGTAKSARDSASVFSQELGRLDEIANQKAMQAGKNFQDSLNASMGIGSGGKSARDSAAVFEEAARGEDAMAASAAKLRAQLNPVGAEQAKLNAELKVYESLLDRGKISQSEFAGAQALASKRLSDFSQNLKTAGSTGRVMSGELVNMSYQLNDVVTGLALGQSPFMIMAQQGGQVVQILQNSKASVGEFAKSAVSSFGSIFTAGRLAVGGIAGVGAAALYFSHSWQEAASEVDRALIGISARTGTSAADINKFTKDNSTAAGLSVADARNIAMEFTKTGNVTISGLKGVGEAIKGYSLLTGTDATEATKTFSGALSGDLLKGIEDIDKRYGSLNATSMEYIRNLIDQGDKTKALQAYIDLIAPANKRAEESVGSLSRAWQGFKNVVSNVMAGPAPTTLEDQLAALQNQRSQAESTKSSGITPGGFLNTTQAFGGKSQELADLDKAIAQVQKKLDDFNAGKAVAELDQLSKKAFDNVNAILPQIDAIRQLDEAIRKIEEAQSKGVSPSNSDAALAVYKQLAQAQQESLNTTILQAQAVNNVTEAWRGTSRTMQQISSQTAVALNGLQGQLNVARQATGLGQMRAQQEATINSLILQGVSAYDAQLIAAKQLEISQAAANASVEKQIQSLEDQTRMIKAIANGTGDATERAIAYENAIRSGASETQAAALAAAMLSKNMASAAAETQAWRAQLMQAQAVESGLVRGSNEITENYNDPKYLTSNPNNGEFDPITMSKNGGSINTGGPYVSMYYNNGGRGKNIGPSGTGAFNTAIDPNKSVNDYIAKGDYASAIEAAKKGSSSTGWGQPTNYSAQMSQVDTLTQQLNSMTTDKNAQAANLKSELDWLNTLPQTLERDQKIVSLKQSIDQLADSTDSLNGTMQEALSPYYAQDPRTSHIGFRSQGMATGGYVDVPGGISTNDNMMAMIPVASGERISVDPQSAKRGIGGAGNNVTINMPITIQGDANKDEVGRTMYQAGQDLARQLQAVSR